MKQKSPISSLVLSRRGFLSAGVQAGLVGSAVLAAGPAAAQTVLADLRGSLDITRYGVRPGAVDNQSAVFQEAINAAARDVQPLFVPAGDYLVSNIDLPSGISLVGVPGQTSIRYAGDGHLMFATGVSHVRLSGLTLDGGNRMLADYAPALLHVSTGTDIAIEDCAILGSLKDGVVFDRVGGRVERCSLTGIMGAAFHSNDAQGLAIRDNVVSDCGDNGILVYRWQQGRDASIISGNRIERIRAVSGGTGPYGNGINLYRADDVIVSGNTIHDCDFSALRANSSSNVQMIGNHCTQSGEVAIFCEFGFQGAVISNNLVDGAAAGISVANFLDGGRMAVVQGNLVRNLAIQSRYPTGEQAYGVGIHVEADTSVVGNVVEDAALAGIRMGWGPYLRNVVVAQNIIRRAPMGVQVSVVEGVGSSIISGNIMDDTPDGAVVGMRWWDRATPDLTITAPPPGVLSVEGNQSLS